MTTYTKTQLIDMAIDKLGEKWVWKECDQVVYCSEPTNYSWYDKFQLHDSEGMLNVEHGWQLVCTREEFEKRVVERKMEKFDWIKVGKYVRTPNGSVKEILFVSEDNAVQLDDHKYYCRTELQPASKPVERDEVTSPTIEWWDYEKNEMLCNPPVGTHCEFTWGNHVDWFESILLPDNFVAYKWYGEWRSSLVAAKTKVKFRPLDYRPKLTERQQAGLKLWRAINWDSDETDEVIITSHAKRFEDYCRPFDQGLLK